MSLIIHGSRCWPIVRAEKSHVAAPENKQDDIVRIVNAGVPNIVRLNEADVGSGDR